jgi:1,4-alpha-glucan branching enzyme
VQETQFKLPEYIKDLSIYEVNLRQYSMGGTFKEFEHHLPRLKALGVGILWFMPIQPIGLKNRKGVMGSYYSIKDFLSVDPTYGTIEEFKQLVKTIHSMGMFVILDWVANHTSWDNNLTIDHPEFYYKDEKGDFKPPFPEWEDVIHLDYSNYSLRQYMTNAMKFWVSETGIDGFRCDMANLVPLGYWETAIRELHQLKDVFMLAEAEDRALLSSGFDVIYNWGIHHLLNSIPKGERKIGDLDGMSKHEFLTFPENKSQMLFTSNHDENSWNGSAIERLGHSLEPAIVLTFTLPGIPLIYSGQEAGLWKRLAFFDKDLIEWKEDKLRLLFTKLNGLKLNNPALWNGQFGGNFRIIPQNGESDSICYIREKNGNRVIVMINFSDQVKGIKLGGYAIQGNYTEFITNTPAFLVLDAFIMLKAWDFKIFIK